MEKVPGGPEVSCHWWGVARGFCGVGTASWLPFLPEDPQYSVPVGCFGVGLLGKRVRLQGGEGETWASQGLSCREMA